jgi:phage repressor protein C with HTH and peptisase S24 domain/DNA-binding XRE family transcriptional regulator
MPFGNSKPQKTQQKPVNAAHSPAAPQWATHISALRQRLHLSQIKLGTRLSCSAMTISRWERGLLEPSANHYIQLGNLAGRSECWFYWRRAGLNSANLLRLMAGFRPQRVRSSKVPELQLVFAGSGEKLPDMQLVAIPVLQVHAGTHGETGDDVMSLEEAPINEMMAAPRQWCPNPQYTKCLRVRGHSMMPLIRDGNIVAVDTSQTDISELDNTVVIAWNEQKGLCISRFRHYGDVSVLEPENREYKSVVLGPNMHGWRIVAKVLWWIGKAP